MSKFNILGHLIQFPFFNLRSLPIGTGLASENTFEDYYLLGSDMLFQIRSPFNLMLATLVLGQLLSTSPASAQLLETFTGLSHPVRIGELQADYSRNAFTITDYNRDGNLDIIQRVPGTSPAERNHLFLGYGDGTFAAGIPLSPGAGVGFEDLYFASQRSDSHFRVKLLTSPSRREIYYSDACGNETMVGTALWACQNFVVSDFNGDFLDDIACGTGGKVYPFISQNVPLDHAGCVQGVSYYRPNGTAGFSASHINNNHMQLVVADIDNDGDTDIVVASETGSPGVNVDYLLNELFNPNPLVERFMKYTAVLGPVSGQPQMGRIISLAAADFNQDGRIDIAVGYDSTALAGPVDGRLKLFKQAPWPGTPVFLDASESETVEYTDSRINSFRSADLGRDGKVSLIVSRSIPGTGLEVLDYTSQEVWTRRTVTLADQVTGRNLQSLYDTTLAVSDIDQDGWLDLVQNLSDGLSGGYRTYFIRNVSNRAPELNFISSVNTSETNLILFEIGAVDPDPGAALSLSSSNLPIGAELTDHGDGTATFYWMPSINQAGTYSIRFEVTDGSSIDYQDVNFEIQDRPVTCSDVDANGDRKVDFKDLTAVLTFWGYNVPTAFAGADADGDRIVQFSDISMVLTYFGCIHK